MSINQMIRTGWATNWPLALAVLIHIALIPCTLLMLAIDPKVITGAPAWIKPVKFVISGAIYCATFLWLLTYVEENRRRFQIIATLTGIALVIEVVLIIMQVVRNTTSHFNASTPFDATIFSLMGTFIAAVMVCNLLLGIQLTRQKMLDPVFAWSLRLGIFVASVGMGIAFLMTAGPTPTQLAALQAGDSVTSIGAHAVGVEDGGPGLPLMNWSTTGGDLRVPHFFGLHAIQIIPFMGWLLARPAIRRRQSITQRLRQIWIGGLGYLGFVLILTWQALRGQSVVAPDSLTLFSLAGLAAIIVGAIAISGLFGPKDGNLQSQIGKA